MAGIPSHLLIPLRKALADCDQFETNRGLRSVFADARLTPWRYSLPEADGIMERVESTINYLQDKKHSNGSNALVSLLLVLAESMDDGDARQKDLRSLAAQLGGTGIAMPAAPQPVNRERSQRPASGRKSVPSARENTTEEKPVAAPKGKRDFFISYNRHDRDWAEWIAWQLENEGYTTFIQAWDFRPGSNFVNEMQEAAEKSKRTIAVLSRTYLTSKFTKAEWSAALARDPAGEKGLLLPVKVRQCKPKGLWGPIVYIDLMDTSAEQARERLLAGIERGRAKPSATPGSSRAVRPAEPPFPDNS